VAAADEATVDDGEATGEASGGRAGLGAGTVAADPGAGAVGVGAAAPAPHATVVPSVSAAKTAPHRLRRELALGLTLTPNRAQYIDASAASSSPT
jgi:hypothetical protein